MLAARVRTVAKEKGVPVYEIEMKIGIAKGSISKWNEIAPSWDKVKAVADFLGVPIDSLTTDSSEQEVNT